MNTIIEMNGVTLTKKSIGSRLNHSYTLYTSFTSKSSPPLRCIDLTTFIQNVNTSNRDLAIIDEHKGHSKFTVCEDKTQYLRKTTTSSS